ncbi:MAG: carbohydrate ABC transporter permease [Spirochaetaceae bacterium]|nr:MAG: carbohydrate ABC transporter permease [Spirochaetaceae bacterium]
MIAKQEIGFKVFNYTFFGLFAFVTFYPVWDVIMGSLMTFSEYTRSPIKIFPTSPTLSAYRLLLSTQDVITPFVNSVIVTVGGMAFSLSIMTMGAYALSKRYLVARPALMIYILITMLFSGGLIPLYIVVRSMGLLNTLAVLILRPAVNTFYLIIMRTYFAGLPDSLEESAKMEGANDFQILLRLVVPVSMPILATIILFTAVDRWNDFINPLLFNNRVEKRTLQLLLYQIIAAGRMEFSEMRSELQVTPATGRMAAVTISTLPILCVYPFLQKHFVKGVMIGSIKG